MPLLRRLVLAAALAAAAAERAEAQGVGFAGGIGLDPSQAYIGTHFESPPLGDRIFFRPGIDGAFGGNESEAIIDVFFLYKLPLSTLSPWSIYQGTGPVVTIARANDELHAHGGLAGVFGVAHHSGFFFEFKVSGGGGPSLRVGIGYTIRHQQP
jgi:hypothetical protein